MIHILTFPDSECDGLVGALAFIDDQPVTDIIRDYEMKNNPSNMMNGQEPRTSNDWAIPFDELCSEQTVAQTPPCTAERVVLLACGCGFSACSRTQVDIQVTDTHVIWSNIRTSITKYEPYPNLGPWKFNRTQYEDACNKLHEHVRPKDFK